MNLSMRWLGDHVKPNVAPRAFAEAMTMSGSKVEGWQVEGADITGVVVGKITAIEKHPNADSLVICQLDVGQGKTLQIVTAAKNVAVGDLVPVACDGATLTGGKAIAATAMRGVESQGMLCSLGELGLTAHDFPYAIEDGIFILQEDCAPGDDIRAAIGLDDTIVEFEITPNRPDCLSVTGLAREAAVTFGQPFVLPEPVIKRESGDLNALLSVDVQNPKLCLRYVARAVTKVKIAPSPRWLRERLRASGVRAINNIVDITNYVMLEYGQPMHAFDINCVRGQKLIVRNAQPGETIETLDGVTRVLSPEMLVIADGERPSAVAGVMGGADSGIHGDTVTVVFESACFLGSSVRATSRKLGLRTESSSRFEKGLDPAICRRAADRACELVELLGCGEVVGGVIDVNNATSPPLTLTLDPDWTNRFLGIEVPQAEMQATLKALGFGVDGMTITVPSWRADVEHKVDLSEEVARFYGYNNIPVTAIRGAVYGQITPVQRLERLAVSTLLAQGLYEVVTYTFLSPKALDRVRIPQDSPLRRQVRILNPLGEDTSVMRTCVFPSMLEVLSRNYNNRNPAAGIFELATEYFPRETPDELADEQGRIAIGLYGPKTDYYSIKGAVEALLAAFGVDEFDVEPVSDHPTFHPGRCARILKDGRQLALLGEVHPAVLENYQLETRAYLASVDRAALFALARVEERRYHPLPRFPAVTRDLALLCDDKLPVLTLEKAMKQAVGELLEGIELFDCYRGAQIAAGQKSLAFALTLRAADHTLTDAEATAAIDRALDAVRALGAGLRA